MLTVLLAADGIVSAQSLYKYRGADGEWIYSDRPPGDDSITETRRLDQAGSGGQVVIVTYNQTGSGIELVADNPLHAPVQIELDIENMRGLQFPDAEDDLRRLVPPQSELTLLSLDVLASGPPPSLDFSYTYLLGDPAARHAPPRGYRAPFALAGNFPVSQAYPDTVTHTSPDSYHAVDIAMPAGTDVFAARDGIVIATASDNFAAGMDPDDFGSAANIVQILHDDGTFAIYAHLGKNSVRVSPGDQVQRGQYIADSGNTGYSSGPHLHFAVLRNTGKSVQSVEFAFEAAGSATIVPSTGTILTAY